MPSIQPKTQPLSLTREHIGVVVLGVGTALVFYACFELMLPFVTPITLAVLLAVIAQPLFRWLCRRFNRRSLAAAFAVLVVALTIVVPVTLISRVVAREAANGMEQIRTNVANGEWRAALDRNPVVAPVLEWMDRELNVEEQIDRVSEIVMSGATTVVSQSIYVATGLLIMLYLLFYFLRDQHVLLNGVRKLLPLTERDTNEILQTVLNTMQAVTFGTLLVAIVQGVLGGLIFWWLDLPAPVLWGTVMAIVAILPVFGTALVWVPTAAFLAITGEWQKALFLAAWGVIAISMIDNLLYPALVKGKMHLHAVLVFLAVLGGTIVFGPVGIVLGPVVLAVAVALIEIWRRITAEGTQRHFAP